MKGLQRVQVVKSSDQKTRHKLENRAGTNARQVYRKMSDPRKLRNNTRIHKQGGTKKYAYSTITESSDSKIP